MAIDAKKKFKPIRSRSYLNKDFDSFRAQLLDYARTFYPDRIADFSEASVGGMFLDFSAFVGDTLSFYMDHQFGELNPETAIEQANIERLLRTAGVKIVGASPAVVDVTFTVELPATLAGGIYVPLPASLPLIKARTIVNSQGSVSFELTEDLDFTKRTRAGDWVATIKTATSNADGSPATLFLSMKAPCLSGKRKEEKFSYSATFVPFRTAALSKPNVTEVISAIDTDGNEYFEVEALTQDSIFFAMINSNLDNELVKENMELRPAPYRYVTTAAFASKKTTLTFGSGDAQSLDDDIVPDPSEFAMPLYGKRNFSRFSINPGNLLKTRTLGISPTGTTVTVTYRHGGGLDHNVPANSIRTVKMLLLTFPNGASRNIARFVQNSLRVNNELAAAGGENPPSLSGLQAQIPNIRNSQARIVTRQDLLARLYTMPSNFGRVFRASVRSNPDNPLASQIFIISRDIGGNLTISPDTLKENLVTYLNEYRMISDAVDILDAQVINMQLRFNVAAEPNTNKSALVESIISKLKEYFKILNFQIDQVIPMSDLENIIFNTAGVISVTNLKLYGLNGLFKGRQYSTAEFNPSKNIIKGLVVGPPGSIFEIKYPNFDIIGSVN